MKKYIISIIIMGGLALIVPLAAEAATLSLSPTAGNFTVGSVFAVNIILDTAGASVGAVDVRYLNYNPVLLEAQDDNAALAGVQTMSGNLMPNTTYNDVDAANGRIAFSQMISGNNTYNGSGVLATVRFKVLSVGLANVNFDFTPGSTTDANVAIDMVDILTSVTNGAYVLSVPPPTPPPTAFPTLSLVPFAEQDPTGLVFPVRIYLDTQGRAIDGVDVILNFDRTRLEAEDENFSIAGLQALPGSLLPNTTANDISNSSGRITFSQTTGGNNTFSGSGVLATIYFKALAEGAASAKFDFTKGKTSDTNVSFGGADILDSVTNGNYTIVSNGLAPIISDPQPTGAIFMSRTLTLKISTNEAASCRYSLVSNTVYDSMRSSFSASSDGLTHVASLSSGFQLGSNSFYARCKDKGGATNQSDFLISFNIITDTIAPYISNPSPIGNFFMPGRYLNLSISTNEAAACRYGSVPNIAYDSMNKSFRDSSDGLTHAVTLSSGFQLGPNSFYARCKDKNNSNINQSDYTFYFNLLVPPKFIVGLEETTNPSYNDFTLSFFNSGVGSKAFEFKARPDKNGIIALPSDLLFAPKSYDMVIASSYHLARKTVNVDAVSGAAISLLLLPAGDLNSDGAVNSLDWSVMSVNWSRGYSSADINRDGKVNSVDWGYLRKNWLKRGDN